MRLSGLQLPNFAFALFLVPLLACATLTPAGAEPSAQSATQFNGDLPAAAAKSNEATEQPEGSPGTSAEQPESGASANEPDAKPETDTAAATPKPAKAGSQILVNVDKSLQEMTVFVDGIEKYQWPVSTGLRGYSTPSGNFAASSMNKIWYSKQWDNAPMPHAIFFTKDGHAIHGSQETKKLGRAASHGCVRLAPKNAETLFQLVEANGLENTKIVLAGVTPGGEAKVAAQPSKRYRDADAAPWMAPGPYQRRGLFGWRQGPGYAPPPRYYREQRRGWYQRPPRGYY